MTIEGLKFAVVREDPRVEIGAFEALGVEPTKLLLIASGGCTAFALQTALPRAEMTLVDPNPAQIEHVRRKRARLESGALLSDFNVGTDDPDGLSECGEFEALFRTLRCFIHEFVAPYEDWRAFFDGGELPDLAQKYWPVAFHLAFSDPFLNAMFGPDATQHAEPGSYPDYFRSVFESGLRRDVARDNPFLHHVLLGHYLERPAALPEFLVEAPQPPKGGALRGRASRAARAPVSESADDRFTYVQATIDQVDLGGYDFIGLSNVFDWMEADRVAEVMEKLRTETRPGTVVLWRQLNNDRNLPAQLRGTFTFDDALGQRLQARDRSLFYSRIHVGLRNDD